MSDAAADAIAAALAVIPAVAALAGAARHDESRAVQAVVAISSLALLVAAWAAGLPRWLIPAQVLGLVGIAHAAGSLIGRRVEHPAHVLPACAVAAAADIASVLSPEGPSNAVAKSETAIALFALASAVPGTTAIAFVLGVGDLIFAAIVFGVAARHGVSLLKVGLLVLAAFATALAASAVFMMPIPALVPVGLFVVTAIPEFRRLAKKDRRAAAFAIAAAAAVVIGVAVR
ncbi:MAG: hypothetical protein HOV80_08590 [Polyangiaceae bacterium]|nr:hypothetical protein [Polyangiaceae bacterium]